MSQPNKDKKFEDTEEILFECNCKGNHYLEVLFDKYGCDEYAFCFSDCTESLWSTIKTWWNNRRGYFSSIYMSKKDVKALIKLLEQKL